MIDKFKVGEIYYYSGETNFFKDPKDEYIWSSQPRRCVDIKDEKAYFKYMYNENKTSSFDVNKTEDWNYCKIIVTDEEIGTTVYDPVYGEGKITLLDKKTGLNSPSIVIVKFKEYKIDNLYTIDGRDSITRLTTRLSYYPWIYPTSCEKRPI